MPESETERERVLVTGAAGTVGSFVVTELLERGYRVTAVDRPGTTYPRPPEGASLDVRSGDLTNPGFCEEVMEGADRVIHTASVSPAVLAKPGKHKLFGSSDASGADTVHGHGSSSRNETYGLGASHRGSGSAETTGSGESHGQPHSTNAEVVRILYEAARRANVKIFVYYSAGSIYKSADTIIDEEAPLRPTDDFQRGKVEAEETLRELARLPGPSYVILRPSLIYGPGVRLFAGNLAAFPPVLWLLTGGRMVGFTGGPKSNWLHAEDAARCGVFVMEKERAWGETLNIADDTPLSLGQILTAGVRAYRLPVEAVFPLPPKWMVRTVFRIIDSNWVFKLLNLPLAGLWTFIRIRNRCTSEIRPRLDRTALAYLSHDIVLGNRKIKELGFRLKWPDMRKAYPSVLRWYQDHRWVPTGQQLGESRDVELSLRISMKGSHSPSHPLPPSHQNLQPGQATLALRLTLPKLFALEVNRRFQAEGSCLLAGLADNVSCSGTVELHPVQGRVLYDLDLRSNEGEPLHLRGATDVKRENLKETLSGVNTIVYDDEGREVTRADFRIDLAAEILPALSSVRVKV
jgi:nucleoside-diphosphate-sugar epimerase